MSSSGEEEDWNKEFGITPSIEHLPLPFTSTQDSSAKDSKPSSLFLDDTDSDEDWSGDFAIAPAPQKILGIKADPNAKEEDWDADFEFTNDTKSGKATT